jgi:hypothetical protein
MKECKPIQGSHKNEREGILLQKQFSGVHQIDLFDRPKPLFLSLGKKCHFLQKSQGTEFIEVQYQL